MIKYIGSKRKLLPQLLSAIQRLTHVDTVLDLFSGTSRVGHALKKEGYRVHANDHNRYAYTLGCCYVQADGNAIVGEVTKLLEELQALPPKRKPGYFTQTFCEQARFIHPKNGAKIEAIRDHIATLDLHPDVHAALLVSLMEASDRVDSTTGVQMAYLKNWAARAHHDLQLRLPHLLPGQGLATEMDALQCVQNHQADLIYLDPPYNQHSYLSNYHMWETLVRWDEPEPYGIAKKRIDCQTRKSPFNSKRSIHQALRDILQHAQARYLLISFNNEGYITHDEMIELLQPFGKIDVQAIEYDRYVGAQIGIYNREGTRVGRVSHLKNVEYLFCVERFL